MPLERPFIPPVVSPRHPLIQMVIRHGLRSDTEFCRYGQALHAACDDQPADYLYAAEDQLPDPASTFARLRWGGQLLYASRHRRQVAQVARRFADDGFALAETPALVREPSWIPLLGAKVHYVIARKVLLVRPGDFTDRFTYHLELLPGATRDELPVVCKEVPSEEAMAQRLRHRFPDLPEQVVLKRARYFTQQIFPTFLTREASILEILHERLPVNYGRRVPRLLGVERDERGLVRRLRMTWLRNGGHPLSQIEFALQSADLLRAIHDAAGIIHLDLRLDNFVINDHVGFVDFGSAVGVGEDLNANPRVAALFGELMRTSQIQRILERMTRSGHVTAEHFCRSRGRVDKSLDVFFLAVQVAAPRGNPDLKGLIRFDPSSEQALALARLSCDILKPADPAHPQLRSAGDITAAVESLEHTLRRPMRTRRPAVA